MNESAVAPRTLPSAMRTGAAAKPDFLNVDFDRSPFLVIWESTQACSLVCMHCRAEAHPCRDPQELTTEEVFRLLDETRKFGRVLFVITGGDPLERPDIFDIIRHGAEIGLRMTMTPAGTAQLTRDKIVRMREEGLARLAVSLDGPNEMSHDAFRGVPGSFRWTMDAIRAAREIGLEVQVNTTITRFNQDQVEEMAQMLSGEDIVLWSVFFLVPVGRGLKHHMVTPEKHEAIFHQLYDLCQRMPYDIKTTAAQHYRRVAIQRAAWERLQKKDGQAPRVTAFGKTGFATGVGRAAKGVNDGRGFVFVSYKGEVMPSGFLPVSAGNVRDESIVELYRNAEMFRALRRPSDYVGKCGYCDFNEVCGGSRSRAYSVSGNYMGSEPFCTYRPARPGSERPATNTYKGPFRESSAISHRQALEILSGEKAGSDKPA